VQLQLGEKFIFPLSMPAPLTSLFGWRMHPIFGARRFHTGTDVGAPTGTSVVATQSGRVTLSDYAGGYGLMVVLRHNNDTLESRYAHLSRLLVQVGEWVEQGEVIGLVGSTGNSTGPHLHFELRQLTNNGWVVLNPDSLLKQTLNTLVQAMGNSLVALSDTSNLELSSKKTVPLEGLPFRPAQPHAN
jgi:murein DD-endopeptidase MepM/ murein hydrolase activator NlpD